MSDYNTVRQRLVTDEQFRALVTNDAAAALKPFTLTDAEQEELLQHAETLEAGIEEETAYVDPEGEVGQADAAGAKG